MKWRSKMVTQNKRENETLEEKISTLLEAGFKLCNKGRVSLSTTKTHDSVEVVDDDTVDITKPQVVMIAKGDVAGFDNLKAPNLSHCIVFLNNNNMHSDSTLSFALEQGTPQEKIDAIGKIAENTVFAPQSNDYCTVFTINLSGSERSVMETLASLEALKVKTVPFSFDASSLNMLPIFYSGVSPSIKDTGRTECYIEKVAQTFGSDAKGLFGITRRLEEKLDEAVSRNNPTQDTNNPRLSRRA